MQDAMRFSTRELVELQSRFSLERQDAERGKK